MENNAVVILLSDARGIYIPRDFVQGFHMDLWHVSEHDAEICQDPDNEWYWEAWYNIIDNAFMLDKHGNKYQLYQDGDLWAYCFDLMSDEEKQNMGWEID